MRLSRDKALEIVGNSYLLQRVVSRISFFQSDIIVVTATPDQSLSQSIAYPKLKVISDICPGRGPLGGRGDVGAVGMFGRGPNILVVHPSVPANSVQELIALAKAKPGQLNFASSGVGVVNYMCMELFKTMTGINFVHIPYKGGAPATVDLLGGQVQVMFNNLVELAPHIKAGKLRALAVATPKRIAALPDLPTVAEAGVPGYEVILWYGMVAPAGTPKAIINKLNTEIAKIQKMPDVLERLNRIGAEPIANTPEEMGASIKAEMEIWAKVIKEAGLKPE